MRKIGGLEQNKPYILLKPSILNIMQTHPFRSFIYNFYSSRVIVLGFIQIPPRGGHPSP